MASTVTRWGRTGWHVVGVLVAVGMLYSLVVAFSGLVVPLVLAAVLGILGVAVVDWLEEHRVPRPLGALILIVGLLATLFGVLALVVVGIIEEGAQIRAVVTRGVDELDETISSGAVLGEAADFVDRFVDHGRPLLTGAAGWVSTIFSSAVAFALGSFLALFMLYYVLVDWATIRGWLATHLHVSDEVGNGIVDDAVMVVRRGFTALTLTSLVTTAIIGAAMLLLDLPLALAVTLVTFVTSYVPYLGAILSGAFGFLIALGSGGLRDAVILLLVILVAQNVVQTLVGNRLTSDRLALHPLPSIMSSVCGVAIAGLLGAMLSAPTVAFAIAVNRRVRASRTPP